MSFNKWKCPLVPSGRARNKYSIQKKKGFCKARTQQVNAIRSDDYRCKKFKWTVSIMETVPGGCTYVFE
jgi:hypothetical protein